MEPTDEGVQFNVGNPQRLMQEAAEVLANFGYDPNQPTPTLHRFIMDEAYIQKTALQLGIRSRMPRESPTTWFNNTMADAVYRVWDANASFESREAAWKLQLRIIGFLNSYRDFVKDWPVSASWNSFESRECFSQSSLPGLVPDYCTE